MCNSKLYNTNRSVALKPQHGQKLHAEDDDCNNVGDHQQEEHKQKKKSDVYT